MADSTSTDLSATDRQKSAREAVDILQEIATLLNTGLSRTSLSACISLLENGVNPEALATVVKELRKEGDEARRELGMQGSR